MSVGIRITHISPSVTIFLRVCLCRRNTETGQMPSNRYREHTCISYSFSILCDSNFCIFVKNTSPVMFPEDVHYIYYFCSRVYVITWSTTKSLELNTFTKDLKIIRSCSVNKGFHWLCRLSISFLVSDWLMKRRSDI